MKISIFIICLFITTCCITSPSNEEFSFKITVNDSSGNPVEGLYIVLLNKFNTALWEELNLDERPITKICFSLEKTSFVEINILDINKNTVCNLIAEEMPSGNYSEIWFGKDNQNNYVDSGVYYCSMKSFDNEALYYQDEILMYMFCLNVNHKNGSTDAEGIFQSHNKNPYANLFDLDSLQIVDDYNALIGNEAFSDTTVICLFDENAVDIFQFEDVVVKDQKNEFFILWNPESSSIIKDINTDIGKSTNVNFPSTIETKLIGNYPNPF